MKTLHSILGLLLLAFAGSAQAMLMLDQSYDATSGGSTQGIGILSSETVAQTFTVGIAGLLSQVDLQVNNNSATGDLTLNILTTSGGTPTSTSLGSVTIPQASVPAFIKINIGFVSVDVSGLGILLDVGDMLALELSYSGVGDYVWRHQIDTDPYSGGAEFFRHPPSTTWSSSTGSDAGFKTWVETVPEPSTFFLMGLGLAGLGFTRRKMKA